MKKGGGDEDSDLEKWRRNREERRSRWAQFPKDPAVTINFSEGKGKGYCRVLYL